MDLLNIRIMNKFFSFLLLSVLVGISLLSYGKMFNTNVLLKNEKGIENIVLFTDRDIYIAGEEALVSFRLFNSSKGSASNIAYLVLRNQNQTTVEHITLKLTNGFFNGSLFLSDTLSTGYYELVGFTNFLKNYGEETYCTKQILVVNRFDKEFANSLNPKDAVTDTINISSDSLSIAYVDWDINKRFFSTQEKVNLSLKGNSTKSVVNISVIPKYSAIASNSTYYYYKKVDSLTGYCYPKEIDGIYLSGILKYKSSTSPTPNARVFLSTPETYVNLKYSLTDSLGRFFFHLSQPYQGKDVYLLADSTTFSGDVSIQLDNRFKIRKNFKTKQFALSKAHIDFIKKSQDIVRVHKSYKQKYYNHVISSVDTTLGIPMIYSKPSYSYKLSDYVPLNDFAEITREIIPYVRVRKESDKYSFIMMNGSTSFSFFNGKPTFFINGMPSFKPERIIDLGSDEINRIEVLNRHWHYGDLSFYGIMSVYLNDNVDIAKVLPHNITVYNLDSFANETIYNEIDEIESIRFDSAPDFRQVLYWRPNNIIEANKEYEYSFYTSHLEGDFVIVIEGFTTDNIYFKEVVPIIVKK